MFRIKFQFKSQFLSLLLALLLIIGSVMPALAFAWTAQTSGTTDSLRYVAYGGGQFVAVGGSGTILTSPDGVTWTAQTSGTTLFLLGVTYDNNLFVAVGLDGTILTSPDGVTWTSRGPSGEPRDFYSVKYGGGTFVAVGSAYFPSSLPAVVNTSPDGITWTAQTSGLSGSLLDVVYAGSQFVAVGNSGVILTSPNGVTWTAQTSGTSNDLIGVTYDGSQLIVVGHAGTILTSPDGVTWTAQTSGTTQQLLGVTYGGSQFVAVGASGAILTSPDGVTWTADSSGTTQVLFKVGYDGSKFVTVGNNGTILTSGNPGPSLNLTKSVSPSSAKPGEAITYTIAFSNTGAITATNVVITDSVPVGQVSNLTYTSNGAALTLVPGSQYVWTAPDLLQNDGGVITITGVLTKPLAAGVFTNTVTLAVSGTVKTADAPLTVENVAPAANAGVDQTKSVSDTVTLSGSGTDDNGDTLTYGWTQSGGSPAVALSNPAAQCPTFTAPSAAAVLTFTLTVTDAGNLTDTDEVVVSVVEGYIYYFPIMFKNATVP